MRYKDTHTIKTLKANPKCHYCHKTIKYNEKTVKNAVVRNKDMVFCNDDCYTAEWFDLHGRYVLGD